VLSLRTAILSSAADRCPLCTPPALPFRRIPSWFLLMGQRTASVPVLVFPPQMVLSTSAEVHAPVPETDTPLRRRVDADHLLEAAAIGRVGQRSSKRDLPFPALIPSHSLTISSSASARADLSGRVDGLPDAALHGNGLHCVGVDGHHDTRAHRGQQRVQQVVVGPDDNCTREAGRRTGRAGCVRRVS